jgi:hypothetical protein
MVTAMTSFVHRPQILHGVVLIVVIDVMNVNLFEHHRLAAIEARVRTQAIGGEEKPLMQTKVAAHAA